MVVNPTTIFGAGDNHCNSGQVLLNAKKGKLFAYPPGGNTVIDVNDVIEGMIAAMSKGRQGHRYILGNERLSYKAITEIIFNVIKEKPPKHRLHKWLLYVVGLGNDALSRLIGKDMYPSLPAVEMSYKFMYYNSYKAFRELGFKPVVSIEESIRHTHQWYLDSRHFLIERIEMKVFLVNEINKYDSVGINLLSSILKNKGHEARVFLVPDLIYNTTIDLKFLNIAKFAFHISDEEYIDYILSFKPDVIGFSVVTMYWKRASHLAQIIKRKAPHVLTIAGGPHTTVAPIEDMFGDYYFDYIVKGDGEISLPKLIEAFEAKNYSPEIPGVLLFK